MFQTVLFDSVVGTIAASMVERPECDPATVEMCDRLVTEGAVLTDHRVALARLAVDVAEVVATLCGRRS